VVVRDVASQEPPQVALAEQDDIVEQLVANAAPPYK
jgi:hypothetical protein